MTMFSIFFVILVITAFASFFFGRRAGRDEEHAASIIITPPAIIEGLRLLSNEKFLVHTANSFKVSNLFVESTPVAGKVKFQCDIEFALAGQGWAAVNVIGVTSDRYSYAEIWREINERVGGFLPKNIGDTKNISPEIVVNL